MSRRKYRSLEDAYWSQVVKGDTGCWTWAGKACTVSYGQKWYSLARIAYQIHNHRKPGPLEVVRHKCLHKYCTKPAHLELGSYAENSWDRFYRDKPILDSLYSRNAPTETGDALMIDFTSWTRATAGLLPGQQAVFLDFLNVVADGKAHLVHGANYRDGKPCLVNGTAQMLSHGAVSPTGAFPEVVMAFDAACAAMEAAGVDDHGGYVTPLMAEILIRNFGEVQPIVLTEDKETVAPTDNGAYIEPTDAAMDEFLAAMVAPAPEVVHEDDYARDFVNVRSAD